MLSGRAESFTPNVGQRGAFPSVRSKTSMEKLDSIPPSTMKQTCGLPSGPSALSRTGSKKNGIDMEQRTASATSCSSGSRRSEEHTSELQSPYDLVCRLLLEKKK